MLPKFGLNYGLWEVPNDHIILDISPQSWARARENEMFVNGLVRPRY